jgi:hypothetical protein
VWCKAGYLGLVNPEQLCRLDLGQATHLDCIRYDMCKAGLYQCLFRIFNTQVGEYITAAFSAEAVLFQPQREVEYVFIDGAGGGRR